MTAKRRSVLIGLGVVGLVVVVAAGAAFAVLPNVLRGSAAPTPGPVTVRWFVPPGGAPRMTDPERDFARSFNESQDRIRLVLEFAPYTDAYDRLKTEMAAGNGPDIVGPVSRKGMNGFEGLFLDLAPLMASHGFDSSAYSPALMKLLTEGDAQVGLPYLIFPAFMFYNKDLFARAELPDLPRHVGETYMGRTWDWNTLGDVAAQLTLDENGRPSTDPAFDPDHIAQWGIDFQWWGATRMASAFGGGSFVASDGRTAQIPDAWADAWRWYYEAIWTRHIAPTGQQVNSPLLGYGTTVSSGRIAMAATNGWAINSFGTVDRTTFDRWDIAVMPSWEGQTSGPLDADTFVISKATAHPDEAFEAMLAIMADGDLMRFYGGMPADWGRQAAYFAPLYADIERIWPGNPVSWDVLQEMAKYPAVPSHEANMPNFLQATTDCGTFYTRLQTTPGLDLDAELDALRAALQADFDAVATIEYP
jgi:multiple sugar transport system substrate-binding protein